MLSGRPLAARSPFGLLLAVVAGAVALVLLIPLLVVGAAVAVAAIAVFAAKRWLGAQRRPNGLLDGRENVRVRLPPTDEPLDQTQAGN